MRPYAAVERFLPRAVGRAIWWSCWSIKISRICAIRNSPWLRTNIWWGRSLGQLNLLERRLVDSHATVVIPLDDCVLFVGSLNCAELSSRLSEIAQALDAISGSQFLVGGRRLGERWSLGAV
jgi:hypothetical protein